MRRRNVLIVGDLGRARPARLGAAGVVGRRADDAAAVRRGLLTGVFTVFFDVAYQSYLPHLVGREHLVEGNAKLEAVRGGRQIGGPTAAGFLIQVAHRAGRDRRRRGELPRLGACSSG